MIAAATGIGRLPSSSSNSLIMFGNFVEEPDRTSDEAFSLSVEMNDEQEQAPKPARASLLSSVGGKLLQLQQVVANSTNSVKHRKLSPMGRLSRSPKKTPDHHQHEDQRSPNSDQKSDKKPKTKKTSKDEHEESLIVEATYRESKDKLETLLFDAKEHEHTFQANFDDQTITPVAPMKEGSSQLQFLAIQPDNAASATTPSVFEQVFSKDLIIKDGKTPRPTGLLTRQDATRLSQKDLNDNESTASRARRRRSTSRRRSKSSRRPSSANKDQHRPGLQRAQSVRDPNQQSTQRKGGLRRALSVQLTPRQRGTSVASRNSKRESYKSTMSASRARSLSRKSSGRKSQQKMSQSSRSHTSRRRPSDDSPAPPTQTSKDNRNGQRGSQRMSQSSRSHTTRRNSPPSHPSSNSDNRYRESQMSQSSRSHATQRRRSSNSPPTPPDSNEKCRRESPSPSPREGRKVKSSFHRKKHSHRKSSRSRSRSQSKEVGESHDKQQQLDPSSPQHQHHHHKHSKERPRRSHTAPMMQNDDHVNVADAERQLQHQHQRQQQLSKRRKGLADHLRKQTSSSHLQSRNSGVASVGSISRRKPGSGGQHSPTESARHPYGGSASVGGGRMSKSSSNLLVSPGAALANTGQRSNTSNQDNNALVHHFSKSTSSLRLPRISGAATVGETPTRSARQTLNSERESLKGHRKSKSTRNLQRQHSGTESVGPPSRTSSTKDMRRSTSERKFSSSGNNLGGHFEKMPASSKLKGGAASVASLPQSRLRRTNSSSAPIEPHAGKVQRTGSRKQLSKDDRTDFEILSSSAGKLRHGPSAQLANEGNSSQNNRDSVRRSFSDSLGKLYSNALTDSFSLQESGPSAKEAPRAALDLPPSIASDAEPEKNMEWEAPVNCADKAGENTHDIASPHSGHASWAYGSFPRPEELITGEETDVVLTQPDKSFKHSSGHASMSSLNISPYELLAVPFDPDNFSNHSTYFNPFAEQGLVTAANDSKATVMTTRASVKRISRAKILKQGDATNTKKTSSSSTQSRPRRSKSSASASIQQDEKEGTKADADTNKKPKRPRRVQSMGSAIAASMEQSNEQPDK